MLEVMVAAFDVNLLPTFTFESGKYFAALHAY